MTMSNFKRTFFWVGVAIASISLAACSNFPSSSDLDALTAQIVQRSFRDEGIVKTSALAIDETLAVCNQADVSGVPVDEVTEKRLLESNLKTIRWPADGKFLGDWKEGEKLAQSGRGLTYTDTASTPNGGNCYNCHQITKEEIAFGTIGPSLYNYGKLRGVADPNSPDVRAMLEYTWGKIWNAKAYNLCSNMPRAGHKGVLGEKQIKDIMALLLDPKSPVNQ
jgi:sulfur-oxidizing protein SoxX